MKELVQGFHIEFCHMKLEDEITIENSMKALPLRDWTEISIIREVIILLNSMGTGIVFSIYKTEFGNKVLIFTGRYP